MPATKQSGALKVALPLIAALLFSAFIFGPTLFAPKNQQNQQQTDAENPETPAPDEGAESDAAIPETVTNDEPAPNGTGNETGEDFTQVAQQLDEAASNDDVPTAPVSSADTTNTDAPAMTSAPAGAGPPSAWSLRTNAQASPPSTIGDLDPASGYELLVDIDPAGVGIARAVFVNHYNTAQQAQDVRAGTPPDPEWHYEVSSQRFGSDGVTSINLYMIHADAIFVQDPATRLSGYFDLTSARVWEKTGEGAYRAAILDAQGNQAVIVERTYTLEPGSYDIGVDQRVVNLTGLPLETVWYQYGPSDLPPETSGYRIESRRVRVAHTLGNNPQVVTADSEIRDLPKVFKLAENQQGGLRAIWPDQAYSNPGAFSWVAQTNRHFMFVVHPSLDLQAAELNTIDPAANPIDKGFVLGAQGVYAEGLISTANLSKIDDFDKHIEIAMQSAQVPLPANGTRDLSFGVYLGPLDDRYLSTGNDVRYGALNLSDAVVYQIGFCGVCTFQWIARPLLAVIRFFEGRVVFDWGIAIILLVICVRGCLHPITKKSQVSMMRFGKQMQRLAPKQQKIKERYKDDRQRMNQELAKLMREEQINPLGVLGCLPMLLQSPIWIALYATIYFAFDIRHEPAFFGVFQQMGGWSFLNDLSSPDHFIDFKRTVIEIPLMGAISGFNILPILMGAIFFVQQKYMSPPSSGNLSPEQEQTQKLMKVMIVVMFPIFMYNAPAGLTLYILTSSTLGVLESRYIRAHVDKLDLEGPPPKKKPKATSMRKAVENTAYGRGPEQRNRYKNRGKK